MTLTQIQKMRRQSGFTLVELLIVMLIVGILSIAMLPMYKKYMTKAKYTAEGYPIVATIKTQLDLFIYDKSYAPGQSGHVYGWEKGEDGQLTPKAYELTDSYPTSLDLKPADMENTWHLRSLVREKELQGKLIRPNHVFYACINSGAPQEIDPTASDTLAENYGYAIGVFGDGNGLPQNSGVATMELHLSAPKVGADVTGSDQGATGVVVLGTWENFDGSGIETEDEDITKLHQIRFVEGKDYIKSGCGIFSAGMMEEANVEDITELQGKLDALTSDEMECGDWEFPRYAPKE